MSCLFLSRKPRRQSFVAVPNGAHNHDPEYVRVLLSECNDPDDASSLDAFGVLSSSPRNRNSDQGNMNDSSSPFIPSDHAEKD